MPHPHPIAHAERDVAEQYMLKMLAHYGHSSIVDIGGNPKRHYQHYKHEKKFRYGVKVWSVSPVVGRADIFRDIDRENYFKGIK